MIFLRTIFVCWALAGVGAQEDTETSSSASSPPPNEEEINVAFDAKDHTDWGSYYDPKNIFCGTYDCYSILGFDYEEFGSNRPSRKEITKRYRALSREWHPDKSKHKDAKERFVKIARAYEVLTDQDKRKEYDLMRYNQEAYFQKYGASVLWQYAPQSDATIIILVIMIAINWFSWAAQKSRWQNVANRLIKAAVEDWSPSMGGSNESKQLRDEALGILAEQENISNGNSSAPTPERKSAKVGKAKKVKISGKEKKKMEQEALRPIVSQLVSKMLDFGAGFHQPTWRDLFIVKMTKLPYYFTTGVTWQSKYWMRRLLKKELNEDERRVLTERAVGNVSWELASDDDKNAMTKRELWIMDNLVDWKEEQEVKNLSKADQKYYAKMKKKGLAKDHIE